MRRIFVVKLSLTGPLHVTAELGSTRHKRDKAEVTVPFPVLPMMPVVFIGPGKQYEAQGRPTTQLI